MAPEVLGHLDAWFVTASGIAHNRLHVLDTCDRMCAVPNGNVAETLWT